MVRKKSLKKDGEKILTTRDREIYNFIEMVGICTAKQIKEVFLPNVDITKTYLRLRNLVSRGFIKEYKIGLNKYYYVGRKTSEKMLEHDLKSTELVGFLKKSGAEILNFNRNRIIGQTLKGRIYVDCYIAYSVKVGGKTLKRHIVVEVQRSIQYKVKPNYGYLYGCIEKYNHSSINQGLSLLTLENGFKEFPPLVVVTDIKDETSKLFTTKLLKLPYTKNESWNTLIR